MNNGKIDSSNTNWESFKVALSRNHPLWLAENHPARRSSQHSGLRRLFVNLIERGFVLAGRTSVTRTVFFLLIKRKILFGSNCRNPCSKIALSYRTFPTFISEVNSPIYFSSMNQFFWFLKDLWTKIIFPKNVYI